MIKIIFETASLEEEESIIQYTEQSKPFFEKQRLPFSLPLKPLKAEYTQKDYESFRNKLEQDWLAKENRFADKISTLFNIDIEIIVKIIITNYGCWGFYDYNSKKIFINKNATVDIIKTIKHEVIHLMIESYVQKFKIQHEQKEDIVNKLFEIVNL